MTVHLAKTQISLGIHPVWSESSLLAQWAAEDQSFLHADSEDGSDWVDAQADLSLCCAHMPVCWFCHQVAHLGFGIWCFEIIQFIFSLTLERNAIHKQNLAFSLGKCGFYDYQCLTSIFPNLLTSWGPVSMETLSSPLTKIPHSFTPENTVVSYGFKH